MSTQNAIVAAEPIRKIITAGGIEAAKATQLVEVFSPFALQADALIRDAAGINVTDATQVSAMKEAREQRLAIAKIRVACDKARTSEKDKYLKMGRVIDGIFKHITSMCETEEARLKLCETFAERAEAEQQAKLAAERATELAPVISDLAPGMIQLPDLGKQTAQQWGQFIADQRTLRKNRDDIAEKKRQDAEAERKAQDEREAARAAEAAKLAEENKKLAEQARVEREAREKADREAAALREKQAAAERAEQDRIAKEAADKKAAEAALLAEEARKAEEAAALAAAPDADKLLAYAAAIEAVVMPELNSAKGRSVAPAVSYAVSECLKTIRSCAETIKARKRAGVA